MSFRNILHLFFLAQKLLPFIEEEEEEKEVLLVHKHFYANYIPCNDDEFTSVSFFVQWRMDVHHSPGAKSLKLL